MIARGLLFAFALLAQRSSAQFNPSILQDTRNEPKVDGTFGFLYRTEDGIAHAARGDSNGVIQGRFSYTDPTGLKVNFNYNAGSRTAAPEPPRQPVRQSAPRYSDYDYAEPAPQPRPVARGRRPQPPPTQRYEQVQERENYPSSFPHPRPTRPQYNNDVYDDYGY